MKLFLFLFLLGVLIQLFAHGSCKSDLPASSHVMLAVPVGYSVGFKGRAFLMEANQMVWDSDHFTRFYTSERCVFELTTDGNLQLKGAKEQVGWRTATFGQGVETTVIEDEQSGIGGRLEPYKMAEFQFFGASYWSNMTPTR
ncbi:hypothetical protein CK203_061629 [Vitis vinifera]|uniref:Uncharacterized protein n=1 Tax=Vitis vinifera TaxID=29760 RepID=A0A438FQJ8_VITVI|nr:hypothetical protein CK203_061629 [Vitis vinifera]